MFREISIYARERICLYIIIRGNATERETGAARYCRSSIIRYYPKHLSSPPELWIVFLHYIHFNRRNRQDEQFVAKPISQIRHMKRFVKTWLVNEDVFADIHCVISITLIIHLLITLITLITYSIFEWQVKRLLISLLSKYSNMDILSLLSLTYLLTRWLPYNSPLNEYSSSWSHVWSTSAMFFYSIIELYGLTISPVVFGSQILHSLKICNVTCKNGS